MGICILHLLKKFLSISFRPDWNKKANDKKKEKKWRIPLMITSHIITKIFDGHVIHLVQL